MKRYIVSYSLNYLMTIPSCLQYSGIVDKSIVVYAMTDFIKFSNAQIGMPSIIEENSKEFLTDGIRLLKALELANYSKQVGCILSIMSKKRVPDYYIDYTLSRAETFGTDARVITFNSEIDSVQKESLSKYWHVTPHVVNPYTIGWFGNESTQLEDWLSWRRKVEYVSKNIKPVIAINGRALL